MAKRVLMYGGAKKVGDNSAFYYASLNVKKDYKSDMEIESIFLEIESIFLDNGAIQIQEYLSKQPNNSIQSLDIFCHDSYFALFLRKGASMSKTIENLKPSNLYLGTKSKIAGSLDTFFDSGEFNDSKDQRLISDLNLNAFTNSCKIEIHGCSTSMVIGNFCENLSEALYRAGKLRSVVIGHPDKANPNITGKAKFSNEEQDYRHGEREIHHNGKSILTVNTKGRIQPSVINEALNKVAK